MLLEQGCVAEGGKILYLILFDTVWSEKHQSPNHKNLSKAT